MQATITDYKEIGKRLIQFELPEHCIYNVGISSDSKVLFSDTNDSQHWQESRIALPIGRWSIKSKNGRLVTLKEKYFWQN